MAYNDDFFRSRSLEGNHDKEADIRSKVICKNFDWERPELLTDENYKNLSSHRRPDRNRFWDMYKEGIDQLSYNATQFYYHQFTTSTTWTNVTVEVMDYDSYIGKFVIPLLDCSNAQAVKSIGNDAKYKIKGILSSAFGSTLSCSIHWVDFPTNSRLEGVWHVVIVNRANNLPLMDAIQFSHTLDADCLVTASNTSSSTGQQFNQQTHASRHGPPIPYETKPSIFQPICSRESNNSTLKLAFAAHGVSSNDDRDMLEFFKLETITIQNRIT